MLQTNLIKLYCAVCDNSSTIDAIMQRQSNNFRPQNSDEECITVYLWGISQRRFEQTTIYQYTKKHLLYCDSGLFTQCAYSLFTAPQILRWSLAKTTLLFSEELWYTVNEVKDMQFKFFVFDTKEVSRRKTEAGKCLRMPSGIAGRTPRRNASTRFFSRCAKSTV